MYQSLYELYLKSFPQFPVEYDTFFEHLRPDAVKILEHWEDGRLAGYALVWNCSMSLLCVDPAYRNRGIGSRLLARAERITQEQDGSRLVLGQGTYYLFQGVPEGPAVDFFSRRGYNAAWSSINMELLTEDFSLERLDIPPAPAGLAFRFAGKTDLPALLSAVRAAESNWTGIFETCRDPVLLAELNREIVGFVILAPQGGYFTRFGQRPGSAGCVGVVPDHREKGVGMAMTAQGVQWLKEQGCALVELRYTWLEEWYGKLGFRTTCRQWMAEKQL